jgi:hypothetical protein
MSNESPELSFPYVACPFMGVGCNRCGKICTPETHGGLTSTIRKHESNAQRSALGREHHNVPTTLKEREDFYDKVRKEYHDIAHRLLAVQTLPERQAIFLPYLRETGTYKRSCDSGDGQAVIGFVPKLCCDADPFIIDSNFDIDQVQWFNFDFYEIYFTERQLRTAIATNDYTEKLKKQNQEKFAKFMKKIGSTTPTTVPLTTAQTTNNHLSVLANAASLSPEMTGTTTAVARRIATGEDDAFLDHILNNVDIILTTDRTKRKQAPTRQNATRRRGRPKIDDTASTINNSSDDVASIYQNDSSPSNCSNVFHRLQSRNITTTGTKPNYVINNHQKLKSGVIYHSFPGGTGTLRIIPNCVTEHDRTAIYDEVVNPNNVLLRHYEIRNDDEPRLHCLLNSTSHANSVEDIEDDQLSVPGYGYQTVGMKSRSLDNLPALQKLSDDMAARVSQTIDAFANLMNLWNIGLHVVLYRDGCDYLSFHSDNSQGESIIFTVVICQFGDRYIYFEPIEETNPSKLEYRLLLHPGDAYWMDGTSSV